jgi:hypothetical protein
MKLIFFDVDGVVAPFELRGLSSSHLDLFCDAVHKTGAEVVLSSTWRLPHCREQRMRLNVELYKRGVELFGATPVLNHPIQDSRLVSGVVRGDEIRAWLRENAGTSDTFAILDDDPNNEMGDLNPRLIKCDGNIGLTEENCHQIIEMLGVK